MSKFDEVKRLQELDAKESGDWSYSIHDDGKAWIWGSDGDLIAAVEENLGLDVSADDRAQLILSAKYDLLWLLAVASKFQPGDEKYLGQMARLLDDLANKGDRKGKHDSAETVRFGAAILRRLQEAAKILEREG